MSKKISLKEKIFNLLYRFKYGTVMILIGITILFWDILSKVITDGKTAEVINGFVSVQSSYNTGGAWSIMDGSTWVLILLSSLFIIFMLIGNWFFKQKNYFYAISMGLVLSGALGNLIDRIFLGYVRDFIKLEFIDFPIFNIADCAITVGIILLCVYFLIVLPYSEKKSQKQAMSVASKEINVDVSENELEDKENEENENLQTSSVISEELGEEQSQNNLIEEYVQMSEVPVEENNKQSLETEKKKNHTRKRKTELETSKKSKKLEEKNENVEITKEVVNNKKTTTKSTKTKSSKTDEKSVVLKTTNSENKEKVSTSKKYKNSDENTVGAKKTTTAKVKSTTSKSKTSASKTSKPKASSNSKVTGGAKQNGKPKITKTTTTKKKKETQDE